MYVFFSFVSLYKFVYFCNHTCVSVSENCGLQKITFVFPAAGSSPPPQLARILTLMPTAIVKHNNLVNTFFIAYSLPIYFLFYSLFYL